VVDICKKEVVEIDDEVVVVDLRHNGVDCTGEEKATTVAYSPNNRGIAIATVTKTNIIRLVILWHTSTTTSYPTRTLLCDDSHISHQSQPLLP
jgi:hypothetical protein